MDVVAKHSPSKTPPSSQLQPAAFSLVISIRDKNYDFTSPRDHNDSLTSHNTYEISGCSLKLPRKTHPLIGLDRITSQIDDSSFSRKLLLLYLNIRLLPIAWKEVTQYSESVRQRRQKDGPGSRFRCKQFGDGGRA